MKRIVITGIGPVSALGIGREALSSGLQTGQSALTRDAAEPDDAGAGPRLSGAIRDFAVDPFLKSRKAYLDRTSELTLAAAALALRDAGLDGPRAVDAVGLLLGTAYGNLATMSLYFENVLEKGPASAKPILFQHLYPNTAASLAAIEFNLGGLHTVVSSGWISGAAALLQAADAIATGQAQAILAGGVDALHAMLVESLWTENRLSPRAGQAGGSEGVHPFDPRANGIVLGEGAGILALEAEAHAAARGVGLLAELAGGAIGAVADAADAATVMRRAMERTGCSPSDLAWVCAHGSGDPRLDALEGGALAALARDRTAALPVWTPSPLVGECLAAGAPLRLVMAVIGMQTGHLPVIDRDGVPRSEFTGLDFEAAARDLPAGPVLINTFDPGGSLVSLIVKPWELTITP